RMPLGHGLRREQELVVAVHGHGISTVSFVVVSALPLAELRPIARILARSGISSRTRAPLVNPVCAPSARRRFKSAKTNDESWFRGSDSVAWYSGFSPSVRARWATPSIAATLVDTATSPLNTPKSTWSPGPS